MNPWSQIYSLISLKLVFPTGNIADYSIVSRILKIGFPCLGSIVDDDGIQRGVSPDLKEAFILTSDKSTNLGLESEFLRPVYTGGIHVKRYQCLEHELKLVYTSRETNFSKCPNICKHIKSLREQITCKEVIQGKHPLYALHRPRKHSIFEKPNKLLGVITSDKIILGMDSKQTYVTDGLYLFTLKDDRLMKYVMGVLNSRLFTFLYQKLATEKGRPMAQVKPTLLCQLPIRPIDFYDMNDLNLLSKMDSLVDIMISINKQISQESNPNTLDQLLSRKKSMDTQIDRIVYDMYAISESERQAVELTTLTQS